MRTLDLDTTTRDLLAPCCDACTWWQRPDRRCSVDRNAWEHAVEFEVGLFGKVLLDHDDAVLGTLQAAPTGLLPYAWSLPGGPPSADAWLLTCAFLYDDEFLPGFHRLLQDLEATLKQHRVSTVEAYALRPTSADDRFRGYLRDQNLFNHEVLEGSGFRSVRGCGDVHLYRLELATLVASPRWARLVERLEGLPAAQPV